MYFRKVLNLSQEEKFGELKIFLDKINFNFEKNVLIQNSLNSVFNFLNDRSKWMELKLVEENLVKHNSEIKKTEQSRKNTLPHANSIRSSNSNNFQTDPNVLITYNNEERKKDYSKSTIRESDELKVN